MTREQRIEARAARLQARYERIMSESDAAYRTAKDMASAIPFGQPILVGHYSEKADRRYRDKIERKFIRSVELQREAEAVASVAPSTAILSTDSDALQQLRQKVAELEAKQAEMVAANKLVRKGDIPGLMAMGYSEKLAKALLEPDFCGRVGFPDYALKNNSGNLKRYKERLAQLETQAERENEVYELGEVRITANFEEHRTQIEFPRRVSGEVLQMLKRHGFRWAPSVGVWQRHVSNQANYWAKEIAKAFTAEVQP